MNLKLEQLAAQMPNERAAGDFAWFRKVMFELQEKERYRIATDLHDTTMQDLFFLKRKLTAWYEQQAPYGEGDHTINSVLEYIDVINMNLRQSCFELNPYLLQEAGLVGTVEKLVEMEKTTVLFAIDFQAVGISEIECDLDTKRHLFRIVQELLNNAKKHSQASLVSLQLTADHSSLVLSYEDDGTGFEVERIEVRDIAGTRIGMEQMKSRILSLNGYFDLATGEGRGLKFKATLPLKKGRTA
jgi:two-component system sensor histidine kinase ComP